LDRLLAPLLRPDTFLPPDQMPSITRFYTRVLFVRSRLLFLFRFVTALMMVYTLYWFYELHFKRDYRWVFITAPLSLFSYSAVMYVCWPNTLDMYSFFISYACVQLFVLRSFKSGISTRLQQVKRQWFALRNSQRSISCPSSMNVFNALCRTRQSPFLRLSSHQLNRHYDRIRDADRFFGATIGTLQALYVVAGLFFFYYACFSPIPVIFRWAMLFALSCFTLFLLFPVYFINSKILDQVTDLCSAPSHTANNTLITIIFAFKQMLQLHQSMFALIVHCPTRTDIQIQTLTVLYADRAFTCFHVFNLTIAHLIKVRLIHFKVNLLNLF
jgi:hypothetical protein